MQYRLVLANSSIKIDIPSEDVARLLELIEDERLRWVPINVGATGDFVIPAHVLAIQKL